MAHEPWWRLREDSEQAGGFTAQEFIGDHVREVFMVRGVPPAIAIWRQPALIVRIYEAGNITLMEGEWTS